MTSLSFPTGEELQRFLNLQTPANIEEYVAQTLTQPIQDLFARPKKDIRGQLVHLGFQIACEKMKLSECSELLKALPQACEILEILHAGSLIIDDIEDQTSIRRGEQALHLQYGLPIALNAGNWLYFLPFQKIEQMNVCPMTQARLAQECQRTLLRAHYGQALDVGIRVDTIAQDKVPEVSIATMELKSGVLTGFALQLGAIVAGLKDPWSPLLEAWGRKLGVALQMYDDIGNLSSKLNPEKRGEDLKLRRPSFLFAVAAETLPEQEYQKLLELVAMPGMVNEAIAFLKAHGIDQIARKKAFTNLQEANQFFDSELGLNIESLKILDGLTQKLVSSYE